MNLSDRVGWHASVDGRGGTPGTINWYNVLSPNVLWCWRCLVVFSLSLGEFYNFNNNETYILFIRVWTCFSLFMLCIVSKIEITLTASPHILPSATIFYTRRASYCILGGCRTLLKMAESDRNSITLATGPNLMIGNRDPILKRISGGGWDVILSQSGIWSLN
jgi:hypothetical protein